MANNIIYGSSCSCNTAPCCCNNGIVAPGGINGEIQYNANGAFAGSPLVKFDGTTVFTPSQVVGAPTGGYKGAGTLNATNLYINGVAVIPAETVGPTGPAGAVGIAGPTGPRGLIGAAGPTGVPGALGPVGPTGAQGPTGSNGPTGANGSAGTVGALGPTGATGPTGVGATGPAGAGGAAGVAGPTGPRGLVGAAGPTGGYGPAGPGGPTGPRGPTGSVGPTGIQGSQGLLGPTGVAGPTGPIGDSFPPAGLSTYIQFNTANQFDASSYLTFDGSILAVGGVGVQSGILSLAGLSEAPTFIKASDYTSLWTLTLPANTGNTNDILTTDGTGVSSWKSLSSIGGVTQIIAGSNITIAPTGGVGAVTINATGGGGGSPVGPTGAIQFNSGVGAFDGNVFLTTDGYGTLTANSTVSCSDLNVAGGELIVDNTGALTTTTTIFCANLNVNSGLATIGNDGSLNTSKGLTITSSTAIFFQEAVLFTDLGPPMQGLRAIVKDSTVEGLGNFGMGVAGGGIYTVPVYGDNSFWLIG